MKPLRPTTRILLRLISSRQQVSREQIYQVLWSGREPADAYGCLSVHMTNLRHDLAQFGIKVLTLTRSSGGAGGEYGFTPVDRKKARFISDNYLALLTGDVTLVQAGVVENVCA